MGGLVVCWVGRWVGCLLVGWGVWLVGWLVGGWIVWWVIWLVARGICRGVDLSWTSEMVKEGLFTVDLQRYAKKGSGIGNLLPYGAQLGNLKGSLRAKTHNIFYSITVKPA